MSHWQHAARPAALADVAEGQSIALAVGSQRAALEAGKSARRLRYLAPHIPIIGNLGGVQLAQSGGLDLARAAIDDLQADAIAIHLNPLQEAVQPEGETDWTGVKLAIAALVKNFAAPVIVKEVGAGINAVLAAELFDMGVTAVDVAGFGGTNWARIEAARRDSDAKLFAPFFDWGMSTVDCLHAVCHACPSQLVIASGGVRHGLDAAKAIRLGAAMVSAAGPMLARLVADDGDLDTPKVENFVAGWKQQMALALFLTGAPNLTALGGVEMLYDGDVIPPRTGSS